MNEQMEELNIEDLASHNGLRACGCHCVVVFEALFLGVCRGGIESRNCN
jgi:hypothetical protein